MSKLYKKLFSYICGKPVVLVCIGTDIVGGDCLGPLVGQMLLESDVPAFVYGTLSSPVTALNVNQTGEFVRLQHPDCLVIAIDSAVGAKFEEGRIDVTKSSLRPGAADGKNLNPVGDISITAVTTSHAPGGKEFSAVRLGFVYDLARQITALVKDCLCHSLYYTNGRLATENVV